MPTEKRRDPRDELNIAGTITWHKPDGSRFYEKVLVLNLSDRGALVEAPSRLQPRQFVKIEIPTHQVDGMASVRRCDVKGMKFRVGLEFINARDLKPKAPRWT